MKVQRLLLLLCLILIVENSLFDKYTKFKKYASQHNKKYQSRLHQLYRFHNYLKNLQQIQHLNKNQQGTAWYGQTQFTDMSKDQMRQYLGVRVQPGFQYNYIQNYTNQQIYTPRTDVPDIWNWAQQGAVSEIKNQGSCGSCWTFSTVGNIQGLNYRKNKQFIDLSQQQLIDCDKSNFGCSGGWPYHAIQWLSKNDGLMTDRDYPLRANYSGPCQFNKTKSKVHIKGYMNITHDQNIIKDALYDVGPLSILLDFTGLMHYKGGIADPRWCSTWPDHALVLVGYGIKDGDYWLIKNSWGPKWGINGYFMLQRGKNKCAINLFAVTAVLDQQKTQLDQQKTQ